MILCYIEDNNNKFPFIMNFHQIYSVKYAFIYW